MDYNIVDDIDTAQLAKFHKFIGSLICEDWGHSWRDVPITHEGGGVTTGPTIEKCRRCGQTRMPISDSSANTADISWSGTLDD